MLATVAYPAFETIESKSAPANRRKAWTNVDREYLLRYALMRLSDSHAAEDAVQDTLLAALQSETQFSGRSAVRTWLVDIFKQKIADHYRRSRRTPNCQGAGNVFGNDSDLAPSDENLFVSPMRDTDSPDRQCEREEIWQAIELGLAELPARTADAFRRGVIENGNGQDVCEELKFSPCNYWVMLHRARKHLQEHLAVGGFSLHEGTTGVGRGYEFASVGSFA